MWQIKSYWVGPWALPKGAYTHIAIFSNLSVRQHQSSHKHNHVGYDAYVDVYHFGELTADIAQFHI